MSLAALKDELLSRSGRGAKYGLERIKTALEHLGHPERGLPVVHVAGTNGKGSVCAMVEAIARRAGLRTGMFTSPHLCRIEERVRLDGQPINEARFESALGKALAADPSVTFFEAMALSGMIAMHEADVQLAIFEVGLGGRLDATNVLLDPLCTAIVSIARDHTRLLGETHVEIAKEKAGILKRAAPLVLGPLDDPAREAVIEVAKARETGPVWVVGSDITMSRHGDRFDVHTPRGTIDDLHLSLDGQHQQSNAAVAVGIVQQIDRGIADSAISEGLARVSWAGRLERIERDAVTVLLDCAHNEHAAAALSQAIAPLEVSQTRLIFGAMGDKSWRAMLELLGPCAHTRYYAEPLPSLAGRQPVSPVELAQVMAGQVCESPVAAITTALNDARPGETILVAGSIFLAGAVKAWLEGATPSMAVPL